MSEALRKLAAASPLRDPRYGTIYELAGPSTGLANIGVAWAEIDAGAFSPAHWHDRTEEVYVVIQGRGVMHLGEETFAVGAGDVVSIPPGVIHAIANAGLEPLQIVVATTPPYDDADDHEVGI